MKTSTLTTNWNVPAYAIMTENPVSIRDDATYNQAVSFMIDKGYRAAPVIDASGRPVGVISQSDIVTHNREQMHAGNHHGYYQNESFVVEGEIAETASPMQVRDMMTPAVFQVPSNAKLARVVEEMVGLNVHRLFVLGPDGVLVGVITALDLLRHMHRQLCGEFEAETVPAS